ncbi:MAG TPA: GAF domain-containing protein [Burkholderiales bacterium]
MKPSEFVIREHVAARRVHRGRLFRKYFLLILMLVCGTLVISGGIGLYFAYQENKVALASLQREKAGAAAARIEEFVRQVEQQLAFAALPHLGAEGIEQRNLEFQKVLRIAQAVTDIAYMDEHGREQLVVSRLQMNVIGSGKDRSQEPAFKEARPGQTWFGPVYFRKDTEPYITMAIRSKQAGPVTAADVNLKFIWDVVTRIKIGQKGKAYVVDATGHLVADPDIGLVLRKTNLSHLEQVQKALAPDADDAVAMLAKDFGGNSVLTAHAPIEPGREQRAQGTDAGGLGWKVFVEQPVSEVFAALDATILRTIALLLAGLLFSALAALSLARSMVRPISTLQEGAARIGAGDLDQKIEVHTGDELETLADQFNEMSAQLRESYAGLERKVEERTQELQEALEQQTATSEILKVISSSTTNTQPVFEAIVQSGLKLFPHAAVMVGLPDGAHIRLGAIATADSAQAEGIRSRFPIPLTREYMHATAILDRRLIDVPDAEHSEEAALAPGIRNFIATGSRAITIMPMLRGDAAIGTISVTRRTAGPLSQKQIALLRTFADQAVIAIENVRLFNETKEALERQTATADVLRVISGSPTDVQPVFEAILEKAIWLCDAHLGGLFLQQPDGAWSMASYRGDDPSVQEAFQRVEAGPHTGFGKLVRLRRPVHIPDLLADSDTAKRDPLRVMTIEVLKARTFFAVPLLKEGAVIGAVVIYRREVRPFSEAQIRLVTTFADQAVIAIENVRLFNETKEALEQQTATSDILQVTSKSPTDVKPVFDTILANTLRLCEGSTAVLWTFDGQKLRIGAHRNMTEGAVRHLTENPLEPGDWNPTAQAALERRTIHVLDVFAEPRYRPLVPSGTTNTRPNAGTVLAVPLMRYDELVGVITVWRYERKLFSEKQLAMVNTFAAQAVIAIGNVRLFNETKESLEQQTAISEILRVISASPSDVNPVLQAVAERAARICESPIVDIVVRDGDQLRSVASIGAIGRPESTRLDRTTVMGRSIVDRAIVHVADLQNAPADEYPLGRQLALEIGHRTTLAVPLLREDNVLGTILLRRREVRPFDDKHIALLKTFADQAAIAIENVRLFNETKEALEQQTATAEVLNVISGSITDAHPVFDAISRSVLKLYGARHVALYVRVGDKIDRVGYAVSDKSADDGSQALWPIPLDDKSLTGRAILGGDLVHIQDTETEPGLSEQSRAIIRKTGVRSVLLAPMQSMGVTTGTLSVARRAAGGFTEREVELLRTFADQAVIAMENVRLFREIQEKSAQLEVANKHKSDFLANMSHELRTPLNAIIGFSEVLIERMFGEVNEKQADYLKDIHESGKHLLSLINDILDLSKIEAGRMDLEISRFDLPSALSNAMTLVRERAQRHGIVLGLEVDPRLGEFEADERKVKQILVNLLSNAVKFTPDGGRVDVSAKLDTDKVEIAVKDTGIGIAPEDHAAVFEEFKQVGRDYTRKAEGTGLGLALTKRFVELHGGAIRLQSTPGKGSTFTITLPLTH